MGNANASSGDQFQDLAFPPDYPASVAFVLRNLKNQKDEADAVVNAVRSRVTVLEGIAETSSGRITALETTVADRVKKSSIQSLDPSTIKLSPASIKEFLVTMVNAMKAGFALALLVPTLAFGGGKDIYGNDLTRTNKLGYVDGDLTTVGDLADFGAANPSIITSVVEGLVHPWARAKEPPAETDPTVPYWAKQLDPPAETDPTVKEWAKADNPPAEVDPTVPTWAKADNPPAETDPTVPTWAKQPNPPKGMTTNAVDALANSAVVTNALTVATTNRVAALETATNNLSSSVSGLSSSKADRSALTAHVANTDNPHKVTAAQVGAVPLVEDAVGDKTAVTIGSRNSGNPVGPNSLANGNDTTALGYYSHAEGNYTTASGDSSHAEGAFTTASGYCSHADGYNAYTKEDDTYAFAWNGDDSKTEYDPYISHGAGTFNINPAGGLDGFWIGEQTLYAILTNKADKSALTAHVANTDNPHAVTAEQVNAYTKETVDAKLDKKADIVGGKIPASQLPSYVDDVLEYDTMSAFPETGEGGKIYVAKDTNLTYRWSGTQYVEISPSPVLDDTVTEKSPNGVKSSGIWSWGKSLLPKWLTSDYAEPATVASVEAKADKATTLAGYGITDAVPFVDDVNGTKTAVTIGSSGGKIGENSLANGDGVVASGNYSHAEGSGTTAAGNYSHAEGSASTAAGDYSHAEGASTAAGDYSHAEGCATTAAGYSSHAEGYYAYTKEDDTYAFAWNGDDSKTEFDDPYKSHGPGTFNINPAGGLNGFWIGEQTLYAILTNKADKADIYTKSEVDAEINEKISGKQDLLNPGSDIHVNSIETDSASNFGNIIIKNNNRLAFSGVELSPNGPLERIGVLGFGGKTAFEQVNNLIGNSISATNPTFSSAVLAVGLNIDTNSVAVLNEIASTFGGFPLGAGETATTVGGLLAALAAAIAWLKKNKVGSFKSVGGATATVENGVAKLDDFFTESNSLLTGTIDAEVISKGTAPDAHLEAPTDEHLKLIRADNSVVYDSAKALPYKLASAIGDRVIATMTLTAASTDITLPAIAANDTTVKDFILDVTNAYAVEGVATDAGINIPRTDFKLVTRDGESLTDVTTVKAGKSAFICFTQKSPVVVDGTTYPCWCVIQLPFGDPS